MTEAEEKAYENGRRAAMRQQLLAIVGNLGYDTYGNLTDRVSQLVMERELAIAALRNVCESHGDNDWPDTLDLSDIIDKHLARHLSAR